MKKAVSIFAIYHLFFLFMLGFLTLFTSFKEALLEVFIAYYRIGVFLLTFGSFFLIVFFLLKWSGIITPPKKTEDNQTTINLL